MSSYDVPLWVNPNRRDGRWNVAGTECTQYACLDPDAPQAEMLRGEDLRTAEAAAMFRTTLWELRFDEAAIVDFSTFALAEAAGFDPEALVEGDHERCREEAARLLAAGARGLLSPSAALPGSTSLTLFGPRTPVAWETTARLASMVPVRALGVVSPASALIERTRYFGDPHADLVAFRANARDA